MCDDPRKTVDAARGADYDLQHPSARCFAKKGKVVVKNGKNEKGVTRGGGGGIGGAYIGVYYSGLG